MSQGSGPNNVLQLCAVIIDKFDTYAIATFNITSNPPNAADLTPDALDNLIANAIEDKLQSGDADAAMGALISITDTVLESNDTSGESCCSYAALTTMDVARFSLPQGKITSTTKLVIR